MLARAGKLEADLRPTLHFSGDFQEIPSICFIRRRARWSSFQNDFVERKDVSSVFSWRA